MAENKTSTDSYSDSQKVALYYLELQSSNPAWRPYCPDCANARRGKKVMIKTHSGFECIVCKMRVNKYMKKESKNAHPNSSDDIQSSERHLSRTKESTSRPRAGD